MGLDRSGAELIGATRTFAREDLRTTWRLFCTTAVAGLVALGLASQSSLGAVAYAFAIILGLINVRVFIFFHDAMHNAIFRGSRLGRFLMKLYGLLTLAPSKVWCDSHNYHHAHTAKLVGSSIGSFPVLTVFLYRRANKLQRAQYRIARHWLTMASGYVTIFMFGMCLRPFFQKPKRYWEAPLALALHAVLNAIAVSLGGWDLALRVLTIPLAVSCAMGSYLFYAQHNFPGMELRDRREWEYSHAALRSSSMIEMSRPMHWFTGNIGYHHIHHLNSRIPFYRLPEAMDQVPELSRPIVTSLRPKDVLACLSLFVWDTGKRKMLTAKELRLRSASAALPPTEASTA